MCSVLSGLLVEVLSTLALIAHRAHTIDAVQFRACCCGRTSLTGGASPETAPTAENPDVVAEFEERIRPSLGNPDLIPHYRKEAESLRNLADGDLVYIDRLHPGFGAAAELTRRNMDATRELKRSLDSANNRIYWLTFVLGLYTVALLIATLVLVFKAR